MRSLSGSSAEQSERVRASWSVVTREARGIPFAQECEERVPDGLPCALDRHASGARLNSDGGEARGGELVREESANRLDRAKAW